MKKEDLPNKISVFPLSNAIFFPRTILPLNIFEDRYLQLVEDCMKVVRIVLSSTCDTIVTFVLVGRSDTAAKRQSTSTIKSGGAPQFASLKPQEGHARRQPPWQ